MRVSDDDLFGPTCMAEIDSIAKINDPRQLSALRDALLPVGRQYRAIIATTPSDLPGAPLNISLTKRAEWLDTQVISPVRRLASALASENRPMFSTWPDDSPPPPMPDPERLVDQLSGLQTFAEFLSQQLRYQQEADAGHSQEIRAMLFDAIAYVLQVELPHIRASRGTYDRELRRRVGVYPDLVRRIYREISGANEMLDRLINAQVQHPS
jgi:hypothetical protein